MHVEGYAGDPNKVTASGPGLEPVGVVVSKPTYFDIFTHGETGCRGWGPVRSCKVSE